MIACARKRSWPAHFRKVEITVRILPTNFPVIFTILVWLSHLSVPPQEQPKSMMRADPTSLGVATICAAHSLHLIFEVLWEIHKKWHDFGSFQTVITGVEMSIILFGLLASEGLWAAKKQCMANLFKTDQSENNRKSFAWTCYPVTWTSYSIIHMYCYIS